MVCFLKNKMLNKIILQNKNNLKNEARYINTRVIKNLAQTGILILSHKNILIKPKNKVKIILFSHTTKVELIKFKNKGYVIDIGPYGIIVVVGTTEPLTK